MLQIFESISISITNIRNIYEHSKVLQLFSNMLINVDIRILFRIFDIRIGVLHGLKSSVIVTLLLRRLKKKNTITANDDYKSKWNKS